jgi:Tol biopolymer transport system component
MFHRERRRRYGSRMSSPPPRRRSVRSIVPAVVLVASACGGTDCPFDPLDPGCLPATQAEAPPRALVFTSNGRSAGFDVYTANADGTDVVRLTTTGRSGQPRWSPDGTRIVYTSWRAAGAEIWTMNADGSGQRRVVEMERPAHMADWSPDGTRIAFSTERGDGNFDVYSVDADGGNLQRLTTSNSYWGPRWSPDGRRLAVRWFESSAECAACITAVPQCPCNGRIALLNADGTGLQVLPRVGECDAWPEWSPDGRHILFSSYRSAGRGMPARGELTLMRADGSHPRALTTGVVDEYSPAWSRSTGRIYFVRAYDIHSIWPAGAGAVRITAGNVGDINVHVR